MADYAAAHGLTARALYAGKKILVKKGVLPGTMHQRGLAPKIVYATQIGALSLIRASWSSILIAALSLSTQPRNRPPMARAESSIATNNRSGTGRPTSCWSR